MSKDLRLRSKEAYKNYITDCLAWSEDSQLFIPFIRYLERNPNNFENILKTTITFMKRHGDKLEELTNEELSDIHMEVRESFDEPKKPSSGIRKAATKVATTKKD